MSGSAPHLSVEQFAAKLAPVLGSEHALSRVRKAAKELGHRGDRVSPTEQRNILQWLGQQDGVVAAAARHLLRQFDRNASNPPLATPSRVRPVPTTLADEIVEALSRALGTEKARHVVEQACRERGIAPEQLNGKTALEVLESLTAISGIVGVTARFAKARLSLKFERG